MKLTRKSFLTVMSLAAGALVFPGIVTDAAAQAARAGYRWEKHKTANIMFEVPNAWITTTEGDRLITKPKDAGLVMEFIAIDEGAKEVKEAAKAVDREINKTMNNARVTEPAKNVTQNGLNGVVVRGEGTRKKDNAKIEFLAFVLGDGKGHGLVGVAFFGVGQYAAHKTQVNEVLNSIRPMK